MFWSMANIASVIVIASPESPTVSVVRRSMVGIVHVTTASSMTPLRIISISLS